MWKDKVLLAPNADIAELAVKVGREHGLEGWTFDYGSLDVGLFKAKSYAAKGAKVIVSRGLSSQTMAKAVDVPVVEIEIGAYDLLNALSRAAGYSRKVGVTGPPGVVSDTKELGELLGLDIQTIPLDSFEQIQPAIDKAGENGIEVVVGGHTSVEYANRIGLRGISLGVSERSLLSAMRNAEHLLAMRREEERRTANLNTILDFSYEGILVIDSDGKVILMNKTAQKMFGVAKSAAIGGDCRQVLPFIDWRKARENGRESIGNLCRVGRQNVIYNMTSVVVNGESIGMVMTFQYAQNIENLESKIRKELHLRGHVATYSFDDIVSVSPIMRELIGQGRKMAAVDSNILITGPTGTGKEMFAQSLHNASPRRNRPFVAINCASVPPTLLESELFGYEGGAFTGANKGGKKGYFELANGGTLFLDEIGELPIHFQAHLLRTLQAKEIMRVGGDKMIPVDVRIISATHRALYQLVRDGGFRADLYHRLNVLRLELPPLGNRREDIPLLADLFMRQKARTLSVPPALLDRAALDRLVEYPWEGNVRELENAIERLLVMKSGETVNCRDLDVFLGDITPAEQTPARPAGTVSTAGTLDEIERRIVIATLTECGGDRGATCRRLGISSTTLWRRLKEA